MSGSLAATGPSPTRDGVCCPGSEQPDLARSPARDGLVAMLRRRNVCGGAACGRTGSPPPRSEDLEETAVVRRQWTEQDDRWFAVLHGEVLCFP
jgi:hypothetical protein